MYFFTLIFIFLLNSNKIFLILKRKKHLISIKKISDIVLHKSFIIYIQKYIIKISNFLYIPSF